MAGVCRALVSPEGNGAPSSPPGFLFTHRSEGKALQPLPVRNGGDIGLKPSENLPPAGFQTLIAHTGRFCGFCLMIQEDTNRKKDAGSVFIKMCAVLSLSSLVLLLGDRGA